jgi:hypothetical protein
MLIPRESDDACSLIVEHYNVLPANKCSYNLDSYSCHHSMRSQVIIIILQHILSHLGYRLGRKTLYAGLDRGFTENVLFFPLEDKMHMDRSSSYTLTSGSGACTPRILRSGRI